MSSRASKKWSWIVMKSSVSPVCWRITLIVMWKIQVSTCYIVLLTNYGSMPLCPYSTVVGCSAHSGFADEVEPFIHGYSVSNYRCFMHWNARYAWFREVQVQTLVWNWTAAPLYFKKMKLILWKAELVANGEFFLFCITFSHSSTRTGSVHPALPNTPYFNLHHLPFFSA